MRAVVRLVCALVLALVLAMIFFEDGSGRHATAAATAAQQRRPPRVHKRTPDRVGRFAAFSFFATHANDAAARLEAFGSCIPNITRFPAPHLVQHGGAGDEDGEAESDGDLPPLQMEDGYWGMDEYSYEMEAMGCAAWYLSGANEIAGSFTGVPATTGRAHRGV